MTTDNQTPQSPQTPIAVSPDEAARLAGVGRTTLYAALAKGDLKSMKIGTRRLIKVTAIHDWLALHELRNDG
jgi:excisionase family DNA binding protein